MQIEEKIYIKIKADCLERKKQIINLSSAVFSQRVKLKPQYVVMYLQTPASAQSD